MHHYRFVCVTALIIVVLFSITGCFGVASGAGNSTGTPSPVVLMPKPVVGNVVATTSGTSSAYYATLDITVKNEGAEGLILVKASITQNGKTSQDEMPVFLKQGKSHELKMTFPLVWQGGSFTSDVLAVVP
jgi:hypothetical protein